jgi:hypothetical protein
MVYHNIEILPPEVSKGRFENAGTRFHLKTPGQKEMLLRFNFKRIEQTVNIKSSK